MVNGIITTCSGGAGSLTRQVREPPYSPPRRRIWTDGLNLSDTKRILSESSSNIGLTPRPVGNCCSHETSPLKSRRRLNHIPAQIPSWLVRGVLRDRANQFIG